MKERRGSPSLAGVGVGLIALCLSLGLASEAASASQRAGKKWVSCRGPASLSGFFKLTDHREVAAKRTKCKTARKVVRRFPKKCFEAYAAQGRCKVRASGRWRCRSRIAGSLGDGLPSKEKCKHRRSKLKFKVAYFPPVEPDRRPQPAARKASYDERGRCVDTSRRGTAIPPPDMSIGPWQIYVTRGINRMKGDHVQRGLVERRVSLVLHAGLGSQPLNHPGRIPILLIPDRARYDWDGVISPDCDDRDVDAILVTDGRPARDMASTAAHELFHAYSLGLNDFAGDPWWEEASATWLPGRVGFPEVDDYDPALQILKPLDFDPRDGFYPYAMSRFVQFLDDRGFIRGSAWPLQREVINGYDAPGATAALAAAIGDRASTLGAELAAFWGDRLRADPLHGPQLRPTGRNGRQIRVRQGTVDLTARSTRLDTSLIDFSLADNVKRVEFEFDPPARNGFFWGLVKPDESRPLGEGESVSFCVGAGDEDDLEWRGHFPVTFTNGALATGRITGTIAVRAQTSADQCTNPILNRACEVMDRAGVREIAGQPGTFDDIGEGPFSGGSRFWHCLYSMDEDPSRLASLFLVRYRQGRSARRAVRNLIENDGYRSFDIGDAGAIRTETDGGTALGVAVGREYAAVQGHRGLGRSSTIALARRIARELG